MRIIRPRSKFWFCVLKSLRFWKRIIRGINFKTGISAIVSIFFFIYNWIILWTIFFYFSIFEKLSIIIDWFTTRSISKGFHIFLFRLKIIVSRANLIRINFFLIFSLYCLLDWIFFHWFEIWIVSSWSRIWINI